MTPPNTYTAIVEYRDGWWQVSVDGVPFAHTQTRRLDHVKSIIRSLLVDLEIESDPDAFHVEIRNASEAVGQLVESVLEARNGAAAAAAAAAQATAGVVVLMRKEGYSYRDVGVLLGISYQRVQQIDREAREDPEFKFVKDLRELV